MAKKKIQKTNAIRLVEQKKIAYIEHEYSWSDNDLGAGHVSEQVGIEAGRIFKTLVAVGNKTGPVVVVIPSDHELDLKKIAKVSGNKKVEMLHLRDLEATTGYIRGGCSPIGMKKLFPTFVDTSAKNFEQIAISAGKRGLQMEIAPDAIVELTRGRFAELTQD
ncbi:Cys-tRNA(Pro) deacylase [Enterococcus pingfangensis]|uniref:Cys-tRNA(Pro) deacylase n=1 Tax=Enterococcus pingfangensis TaxID=2559924 RepID=UPI0010F6331D|nr:Cys-tRNA(Pro) deacylase [Enterococcus pingfangensis]